MTVFIKACRNVYLGRAGAGAISFEANPLSLPGLVVIRPLTSGTKPLMAYKEGPERDLVNFPRPKRLMDPLPVRLGFIPDSWFQFFYSKTGVTGPYAFGIGFITYLLSKEILVLEHEFWTGVSFFIMIIYAHKKFGPPVKASLEKEYTVSCRNHVSCSCQQRDRKSVV